MSLNPERMKELKDKYGLTDEAIVEIADSLEPELEETETPIMGSRTVPRRTSEEDLPATLSSAMRGDLSIGEAIVLIDFMDRRERRDQERNSPRQDSNIDRLIEKMDSRMDKAEEKARDDRGYFEKLILGKKMEETEERAKKLEEDLKKREEEDRQSRLLEDAYKRASEKYEPALKELREKVSGLPANQQKSFWEEIFGEVGDEIKRDMAEQIIKRIKGEEEKEVAPVTDKEGKIVFNWEGLVKRVIKLGEKYIETMGQAPPRLGVREVGTPPFSESTAEKQVIQGEKPILDFKVRGEEEIATIGTALEKKAPESSNESKTQPETEVVPETAPAREPPLSEEENPTPTKKKSKGQARKD